jgi:hypothetical protein
MSSLPQPRSRWLDWQPQATNILKTAKWKPPKPSELASADIGSSGLMASIVEQPEFHCENEVALTTGEGIKEASKVLAGLSVEQLYFQDALEAWFQDNDERFWHLDFATNTLTELKPRDAGTVEPIPSEVWPAYGTLLGILILRKERIANHDDVPLGNGA